MRKRYNSYEIRDSYGIGYTFQGEPFAFSVEDFDRIRDICWYKDSKGYVASKADGNNIKMHRLITGCPENMEVDHRNHVIADNRRENLIVCTHKQNMQNKMPSINSFYGYDGIRRNKDGLWVANLGYRKNRILIGKFDTLEDAIEAKMNAERENYGDFSYPANLDYAEKIGYIDIPGLRPERVKN